MLSSKNYHKIVKHIQKLAKELGEITQNLILSLTITVIAIPPLPVLDQRMWEITCILNGAQVSKSLIVQCTKSENDIQNHSQKRQKRIRGITGHVTKKILRVTQEDVAVKEIRENFDPQNDITERQFWSSVAIADYLNDCRYILKL